MYTINRKLTLTVFVAIVMLQGCAFFGIDLTDDRTITVVKSPYLVNLSGDIEAKDEVFVRHTLNFLATQPFTNYEFQAVQIHVTGSETEAKRNVTISTSNDVEEVNSEESTE